MSDKRKIPNRPKPPDFNQKSKLTPRSRVQDANVTLLGVSESRSTPSLSNRSIRPNLDLTFSGPNLNFSRLGSASKLNLDATFAAPSIPKQIRGPTASGQSFECAEADLTYNEYLQAVMKQEIVEKTVRAHEEKINDQLMMQTEQLHGLQLILDEINNEIQDLKAQEDLVQLLDFLKPKVQQFQDLLSNYNAENNLLKLQQVLTKESDLVTVKNIKPIESQEEFDKLMGVFGQLKLVLERITKDNCCLGEIHDVAQDFRRFKQLNGEILDSAGKINEANKKAARHLIRKLSDMFALRNGYF